MNVKPTTIRQLKARLFDLQKKSAELAEDNSEHWLNLFSELELRHRPRRPKPKGLDYQPELEGNLTAMVNAFESRAILAALDAVNWNKTKAAVALGVTRRILAYRMKTLGLNKADDSDG